MTTTARTDASVPFTPTGTHGTAGGAVDRWDAGLLPQMAGSTDA